jgi:hypothetical protein
MGSQLSSSFHTSFKLDKKTLGWNFPEKEPPVASEDVHTVTIDKYVPPLTRAYLIANLLTSTSL